MQKQYVFHLIPNAHLDPVWLWDWREGMNEGLATVRSVLKLMRQFPELTFIRGEASIYQYVERHEPGLFAEIKKMVKAGRWEVVGGTYVQSDTNMTGTETLAHQLGTAQRYFRSRFGRPATSAWWPDSFGHSAGLPELLAEAGLENLAVSRPEPHILQLPKAALWWRAKSGKKLLLWRMPLGWYGAGREEVKPRLDAHLEHAPELGLRNVGVFIGLGDHGGGPCVKQLEDVRAWAKAHPEVDVRYSTLGRFFAALRTEGDLPEYEGELNFCLRGCYTSVAKQKRLYRQAEGEIVRAQAVDAAVGATLGAKQPADLAAAWDDVAFNSFHDILPGTALERAMGEQQQSLHAAIHRCARVNEDALRRLSQAVDTTVPQPAKYMPEAVPVLIYNPHPFPVTGLAEMETQLDYRPPEKYGWGCDLDAVPLEVLGPDKRPMPYQRVRIESEAMLEWRRRVLAPLTVPPLGWAVCSVGYVEGARVAKMPRTAVKAGKNEIANALFRVRAVPGRAAAEVWQNGRKLTAVRFVTVEDPHDSWGCGPTGDTENHDTTRAAWKIERVEVLEKGPLRAALWARFVGGRSRVDLTFTLEEGGKAVNVAARMLWDERCARLKMSMPGAAKVKQADFATLGGITRRGERGEVPGNGWVAALDAAGRPLFGFASDLVYGFDITRGELRASVVRSGRFACGKACDDPAAEPWRPATDAGEHQFRFLVTGDVAELPARTALLQQPLLCQVALSAPGRLPRRGSVGEIAGAAMLALKPAEDGQGLVVRLQDATGKGSRPALRWQGAAVALPPLGPCEIATFRLRANGKKVTAERVNLLEDPEKGK